MGEKMATCTEREKVWQYFGSDGRTGYDLVLIDRGMTLSLLIMGYGNGLP